jgi:hypothetical protein
MSRFFVYFLGLLACSAIAQQPSGTSPSPALGTHMDQSTVQTVGTTPNGAGASVTNPRPSPDAGTALPTVNGASGLSSNPPQPVTKTLGGGGLADPNDVADLLAPKALQPSKLSLIGGQVKSIDQIRDHMTVHLFGAGTMRVNFDQRTHFYRDGKETTQLAVKSGDRVYLDTQLFEGKVFAKNVHVETGTSPADARGQIINFNRKNGDMIVRDELAGTTVRFRVGSQTAVKSGDSSAPLSALRPGALIAVKFSPRSHNSGTAQEVSIIAEPGTSFTYFGRVTHLDVHSGLLAIENQADGKIYEIHFGHGLHVPDDLLIGSQATATATFEGTDYLVQSLEVNSGPTEAKVAEEDSDASEDQSAPSALAASSGKKKDRSHQDKKNSKQKSADDENQL